VGEPNPVRFTHGPHTQPIPPIPPRIQAATIGKTRRPVGDPVAAPKQPLRFEAPPPPTATSLTLPLEVVAPQVAGEVAAAGKLVFHCVGDTGGINGDATQRAVAEAMEQQYQGADHPAFLYLLGDVIYYNGESNMYKWQFYEPYQYYPGVIFAIPGNHDGDTSVRPGDPPDPEPTLYGFMRNFCDATPNPAPYRTTMTEPYAYWTLAAPLATIVGLYSNVEGSLDARGKADQQAWLAAQLRAAPTDRRLLVAVHHPCYSLDSAHGGTPDVLVALDRAIVDANRVPDAVLSGHVHNYQRFSRQVNGRPVPYLVAGAGGYANDPRSMHKLQKGLGTSLPLETTHPDLRLESFNQDDPGFLRVTVTSTELTFEYHVVPFDGSPARVFDTVTV
jgi:hypothetical protein